MFSSISSRFNGIIAVILVLQHGSIDGLRNDERGFLDFLLGPCKCKCGISNREARLLGGEELRTHEFPWMSAIQIENKKIQVPATLINNRYVITAASNLIGLTPFDVKVTLGQFDRCHSDISSTNVSVDKILIHPDFNAANRAHDLALVKLNAPVNIERRVSPICLANPSVTYLGQVATVIGWPTTSLNTDFSCRVKKIGLPVLGREECLQSLRNKTEHLSVDKGCVGVIGVPSAVCSEDAGGPVMFRSYGGVYELIGVFTDKNECNSLPWVPKYTAINPHLSWIAQNTRDACYCFKA